MNAMSMLTKKELAAAYGIHPETLKTRLKEIGITGKKRISIKEQERIYQELGEPVKKTLRS